MFFENTEGEIHCNPLVHCALRLQRVGHMLTQRENIYFLLLFDLFCALYFFPAFTLEPLVTGFTVQNAAELEIYHSTCLLERQAAA